MNVLILGSGGREHAFAWKISESKKLTKLYIAPGNAGTSQVGENLAVSATDFEAIKKTVLEKQISMLIVGPEDPLVKGIHDFFLADEKLKNIPVIGPVKSGAMLEGSKDFSKRFMQKHNIPTARYQTFQKVEMEEAYRFLETLSPPYVLKADGLAAGKGVLILDKIEEAKSELKSVLLDSRFGSAGNKVIIEEFLKGIEVSVFILTDGISYKLLPAAKDYKRIGEKDTGLNTGGMGAVSPVPFADKSFMKKVEERVVIPTIEGLKKDNISYKGFIFAGLMNCNGDPYVIEYNCRMGDPETEAVLPRIKSDLLDLLEGVARGNLAERQIETDERAAVTVVLVSGGYPGDYEKGKVIRGLNGVKGGLIFHAGTQQTGTDVITCGGRVLAVTASGDTISAARKNAYKAAMEIDFDKMYYRKDIGIDLIE